MKTTNKYNIGRTLLVVCMVGMSYCTMAQQDELQAISGSTKREMHFEAKALFGSVLPHYSYMNYLSESYQKGIALHYTTLPRKQTLYDRIWKYPFYGIGIRHITMGNAEKLGNLSMLYAVFNGKFLSAETRLSPYYQINVGLAYAHKNLKKSLYNTAVSSPLSFFAAINCGVEFRLTHRSAIQLGVELEHISNGKTTTPNLGFNSLLLSASCKHRFRYFNMKPIIEDYTKPTTSNHHINLAIAGFYKTDDYVTEKKYFTSVFSAEYEWLSNAQWWGVQAGGDWFYDRSVYALKPQPTTWNEHKRAMDIGVHAGAFVQYSHVVFLLQLGKYIGSNTQSTDFYTRVGLRYEWEHLFANIALRSHGATAQNIEMGVGYKFRFHKRNEQ